VDRKLARKNTRTGLVLAAVSLFMLGLTFLVAAIYLS
jgi:hypothetical protein